MIVLVTDFGLEGPYIGQIMRVLHEQAAGTPVISLFADAPAWNPRASAYLLAAYAAGFRDGTVFMCVVDPAVGSGNHVPVVTQCDYLWYVGPDNGLFEIVRRRARQVHDWEITWRPPVLSASFHGRDLYAPIAARLARGSLSGLKPRTALRFADWPDDLAELIYIDKYGNAMTGLRAAGMPATAVLEVRGTRLHSARTFASVAASQPFWYENSNGLVEIAANQAQAAVLLGLAVGDAVNVTPST